MTLSGNEIRQKFLDYFASKEHTVVKSSNLVPANDPTLYFTNAGMVQFKNTFTGSETRAYNRATSSQKCMRVSGKHNDLENVGRTARHHTFFEMLGNFSFGDYFKSEACAFAWEFLTEIVKLPKDKLWITIYTDDDQAFDIWHKEVGIPKDKIVRLGEKDNFWSMGDTGPCGPCSEIIYEQDMPCTLNNPNCGLGTCDCDKYLEIWNLVFMQFERHADGKTTNLPKPSIDTGMGLERLTALLQNKQSNYHCDLFSPLLKEIEKIVQKKYDPTDHKNEDCVSMRVLADHIRSSVFLISDGVLPSNDGRGYVLRRILRRAIRHGKLLGQTHPFFYRLVSVLVTEMGNAYPELKTNQETIEKVIHAEEERFFETLEKGLKLLTEEINNHKAQNKTILDGLVAFKLYDTYGFPLDLTEIIAKEHGLAIDEKGFEAAMLKQKERARAGWKGSGESGLKEIYLSLSDKCQTEFLGYDNLETSGKIIAIIQNGKEVNSVTKGNCEIIFDKTPFYAESGGQTGDVGTISQGSTMAQVTNTQKPVGNLFVHQVNNIKGEISKNQSYQLSVDKITRMACMRNHTATHIMHATLRNKLGNHVRQAGSLVTPQMLRFDFSHFEGINKETLDQIEKDVNKVILEAVNLNKEELDYDDAIKKGALAFFGDKYEDKVRMISIGDYSKELCGGTHLSNTSEIGSFRIVSESSIAAGVRRIEAITGLEAITQTQTDRNILQDLVTSLKSGQEELPDKIEKLKTRIKKQEKEIETLKQKMLTGSSSEALKDTQKINDTEVLFYDNATMADARQLATSLIDKIKSGIVVVSAKTDDKAMVVVSVSKDITKKYPANKILEPIAKSLEGRGGGKPDIAQAGGPNLAGLENLKNTVIHYLESRQ